MARVPVIVENEQRLRPVTDARASTEDFTVAGRAVGAGLQRAGQALGETAQVVDQIDATYDEARAKQLDNEYQEFERNLLFGDDGFYKKQNADAINARQPTEQAIRDQIASLTARAQNGRERQMITTVLQRRQQETANGLARYSQAQAQSFARVQSQARISNATDNYARYVDDPDRGPAELATIRNEVAAQAALLGLQDEGVIRSMQFDALSKAHAAVVEAKGVNDPLAAVQYLDRHRDEMDPATQLALDRQLHPALVQRDADGIADIVMGQSTPNSGVPAVQASGADGRGPILPRMTNIVLNLEGGGSLAAPRVSPKGARGPMQVMPGTNRDPGYGVRPAQNDSEAERARVGRDYLAAMMARYGNDPARALAAYNGGPGRVDDAIAKHGAGWLSAMPAETRAYVTNGLQQLGGRAPTQSHQPAGADIGTLMEATDRELDARGIVDPDRRRAARAEVERRYSIGKRAEAERQEAQADEAWRVVDGMGDGFTSVSQLRNYGSLSPDAQHNFRMIARQNVERARAAREAAARPRTDIGKWSILSDAYASDPRAFLAIRPEQVRPFLDDGDFNTYLGWRRDVLQDTRNGGSGKTPQWTTESDIMGVSRTLLSAAGLRTGDSKDAAKDAPRIRQFTVTMLDWSRSFKATNGRLPNSEEIRRQADRYLIEGSWQTPGRLWGSNTNEGFAFEAPGQRLNVAVPKDIRQRILAAAPDATDAEIARIYVQGKGVKW